MLLGSGPRENNVKWGWVEVPSPRRSRKKYHSFGSGGWMSCGMLMLFLVVVVGLGGSIVEQKAQMNLFITSLVLKGAKLVTLQKSKSLQKGKRTLVLSIVEFNSLSSFLFEISAWLENQLMEQLSEELKKYVKKFLPLPPVVDYSRVITRYKYQITLVNHT